MCLSVKVGPDLILCGGSEGALKVYNRNSQQLLNSIDAHVGNLRAIYFDSKIAVSGGADHHLKVYDLETSTELKDINDHHGEINHTQFDNDILASCGDDQQVCL